MRVCSRALLALGLLVAGVTGPEQSHAAGRTDPAARGIAVVRDWWESLQQDDGPAPPQAPPVRVDLPQAIPAGGDGSTVVDLSDLSRSTALEQLLEPLAYVPPGELRITVPGGQARLGHYSIGSEQRVSGHVLVFRGDAEIYGRLTGNLVAYEGDVIIHRGAIVSGDVLALRGEVRDEGGEIGGEIRALSDLAAPAGIAAGESAAAPLAAGEQVFRNLSGIVGVFLSICALGFGLVMFGRHNLEVVSDTVSHSFGRAFMTGLIGQLLLLPTFGMLVVGLILSVVGVLLLPFAVVVYGLLVVIGVVGGALAVAHAMGETYTRRRMALGAMIGSPNSYRYLVVGLAAPFALWGAWAVFGWVPVAGDLIRGMAVLVTWLLATAGFGASLLSRAGIRESFAGRILPPEALTDEYLWATPQFGVPAVKRPGSGGSGSGPRTPTSGL